MATTGEKYPTAAVTASESPWSDNNWNTPGNIYADDGNTANVIATSYDSPDQTYVLKASGFDFSGIPDGSVINGVIARVNAFYRSGQGAGSIDLLQLLNTSLAKVGTNQCATPVPLTTNNTTIVTKGSAANKWGNALDAAWVKSPNFGIAIGILATAANADVDVDYVTLEIEYTPPEQYSGAGVISGGGSTSGTGSRGGAVAAQVSGGGTLAAIAFAGMLAAAALFGGGLMAGQGTPGKAGDVILSGGGSLVAAGSAATEEHSGAGALSGGGTIAASGQKSGGGTGGIPGGGTLAASGGKQAAAVVVLAGNGAWTAEGTKASGGAASVSGGGSVGATAVAGRTGYGMLAGGGSLSATGTADGTETHDGSGVLSGGGMLSAQGAAARAIGAFLYGEGIFTADGFKAASGAATLLGGGRLTAESMTTSPEWAAKGWKSRKDASGHRPAGIPFGYRSKGSKAVGGG